MWRRSDARTRAVCAAAALAVAAPLVRAQEQAADEGPPAPSTIERYLTDRGLTELLATHLLERLKRAPEGPERARLADRLGSLYVQLLDRATTPEQRQQWEDRSQELLKSVPEAESFELRLNLAKARYLRAETQAERSRLRLTTPAEQKEAETVIRSVVGTFEDIGAKLGRRVDTLEKRESAGREESETTLRTELSEARRLRSLAMYYSGWCNYYLAYLGNKPQQATEALKAFGWLLNAPKDHESTPARAPVQLLKYEHVARAAMGAALAESARGDDRTALAWLDLLQTTDGVPEAVTRQIFARRVAVFGAAKRWSDLGYAVEQRRKAEGGTKPLEVAEARLLAVIALEALDNARARPDSRDLIQGLADLAMTDLVTQGEVRHVQDLVGRYGSANLGGEGFIVQYVRGTQTYERARKAHEDAGENPEDPTALPAVANTYREARASLANAIGSPDAAKFPAERGNAGVLLGLSSFYAGDLVEAADEFERAFRADASDKSSEDALWLAVVSLDKALPDKPSVKERLKALSALYLRTYPKSDRAAKLLLRQIAGDLVSEDKAVEILLGVDKQSPLYESARRQAATVLYAIYRRTRGNDRDFAALRFAEISEELLHLDRAKLTSGALGKTESRELTTQVITRVRQVLDAVLGMTAPDLDRADKAFEVLDAVAGESDVDLKKVADELAYRRLQLALARTRPDEITRSLDTLHALGGRFANSADRLMYKRALAALQKGDSPGAAAEVVRHGLRVIDQFSKEPSVLADPAVFGLYNTVADAAGRVYRASGDQTMRDISLGLDRKIMAFGNPPAVVLRRFAELAESAGEPADALGAWRMLLSGLALGSPEWYEARYNSLRLLADSDPDKAREALDQHKVLNPDMGPEPWGGKLRDLDARVPARPGPPTPTPPDKEARP
jgi:hypothetical protein